MDLLPKKISAGTQWKTLRPASEYERYRIQALRPSLPKLVSTVKRRVDGEFSLYIIELLFRSSPDL